MAINVNSVYSTVLSILNKEQRGYLTPYEFNKAATQAQLDIFEKYFIDMDQQLKLTQTDFDYSNPEVNIDDELETFKCFGPCAHVANGVYGLPTIDNFTSTTVVYNDAPAAGEFAFYRLGTVVFEGGSTYGNVKLQRLQRNAFYNIDKSDLTAPSFYFPVYLYESGKLRVKPITMGTSFPNEIDAGFIRKPKNVTWGYTVNSVGAYIYDPSPSASVDFEITSNKQTEVILEILKYAGFIVRDPQVVQAAAQELAQK